LGLPRGQRTPTCEPAVSLEGGRENVWNDAEDAKET
jgi:hypothetical protein